MKILMIGNSFTYYHKMPRILEKLTGAEVVARAEGNAFLNDHLDPDSPIGAATLKLLTEEKWDYVVIQEYSNGPIFRRDAFFKSVCELCRLARKAGAVPVLYATWAYREGSEKLAGMNMTYSRMADSLSEAYHSAAEENGALVADAGKAFSDLREYAELYAPDDYHPSAAGSLLAAETIARTIEKHIFVCRVE